MNGKEKAILKYKITEIEGENIRERLKLDLSKIEDYHRYLTLCEENDAVQKILNLL